MAGKQVLYGVLTVLVSAGLSNGQCVRKTFGYDSFVCVCNATFCDEPGVIDSPAAGTYLMVTSTRDAARFELSSGDVAAEPGVSNNTITVTTSNTYQTMLGFGGAFTDATGINVHTLSPEAQEWFLRGYFAPEGIGYSVCRVPIAGSDCSTRPYSYDDVDGDVELQFFSLQPEDLDHKIPLILRAMELSPYEIFIFGSPWSPPAWMKTNGMFNGTGGLFPEMWQPWSEYFVRFVEAYEAAGVPIWGLTPQNEPLTGFRDWRWNTCAWNSTDMRDWLKTNLGPTLEAAGLRRIQMMLYDYIRAELVDFIIPTLEDPEASAFIDGVAVHWYSDDVFGPEQLQTAHDLDPSKFMLYTESCTGFVNDGIESVKLGSWNRGERYFYNILEDMNYWAAGWVDWNMALDMEGGPNWASNMLDSPIIINSDADEYYKQPMWYAMAHISKFVLRDSVRVDAIPSVSELRSTAVVNPNGDVVVLVLNMGETVVSELTIAIDDTRYVTVDIPAKSFQTVVVSPP